MHDALDLRTLDALHDEVRDLVRARSDRVSLTNARMAAIHWVTLVLLSVLTICGVAVNQLPSSPSTSTALSATIGLVVPFSFLVVSDMSKPFGGAWSVSDEPLRGVREHVLPRLLDASGCPSASSSSNGSDEWTSPEGVAVGNTRPAGRMVV